MSKRPAVLLTLLEENPAPARALGEELSRLGADCRAHFWTRAQDAQALAPLLADVCLPDYGAWLIAGDAAAFARPDALRGLALAALAARAARRQAGGGALPILLAPSGGELPPLPTPLRDADIVTRGIGAKTIARLFAPGAAVAPPYRLMVHARPGLGLWLECGPADEPWEGVMLGAAGCAPDAHGVGPAGVIPQRCTLHHPLRGLRLTAGEREFTAWGTGNRLSPAESYFVRLDGLPDALAFGPLSDEATAELFVLSLCPQTGA